MLKKVVVASALACAGSAAGPLYAADSYPTKPITLVVPFTPGGSTDIIARVMGKQLGAALGQPIVIENKPGAGGIVGTQYAKSQPADGYTLIMGAIGTFGANATLYRRLPYDPVKDFAPISLVAGVPNVLAVNPAKLDVRTVDELIKAARAKPNGYDYASGGNGSAAHLATEYFKLKANIQIQHVPYKGTAPALNDLVGGVTSMVLTGYPPLSPFLQAGRLRPIAVATAKRLPQLPDVPTISETKGLEGFEASQWYGLLTVAGTPKPIVDRLNKEVVAALKNPETLEQFRKEGLEPMYNTPEEFAQYIKDQIQLWRPVIQQANIIID
ncbi:MAG: tripartite tricarboxylate transporter substrate binding protein [Pigmentiphaga sp.]|uniref:Bug family tripartite tricarboxylate transporter substrate binding protein n=1 Tax=Pigmentiphaga sp. TaxID=1977564 RepID=UPI0029BDF3BD|nr:tripartite tricarboxylate transporter substrate binding protein [Pigmentiphaga sp.]MDX3904480.1 tripartite tricarboxylate transporter substrate binding protein [Pigmentiphaga sp.]